MKNLAIYSLLFLLLFSCQGGKKNNITLFSIDIWNLNHSLAYSYHYQINKDSLTVSLREGLENESDSILLNRLLSGYESNALSNFIRSFPLNTLKPEYSNEAVSDGDKKVITFKTGNSFEKTISISNYYLPELDSLFNRINELVTEKYRIEYDKQFLEKLMELSNGYAKKDSAPKLK